MTNNTRKSNKTKIVRGRGKKKRTIGVVLSLKSFSKIKKWVMSKMKE